MKRFVVCVAVLAGWASAHVVSGQTPNVGLYRVFETSLQNDKPYANKFADVDLTATYTSPSGKTTDFWGFFDGDGKGGGTLSTGNVWKVRFMPNELGNWTYTCKWSDGTPGRQGSFVCVKEGAGKGVLQPYEKNPHWLAYNGTEPVWLKSYYETGHGAIGQDFNWVVKNVYDKFIEHGYNHLQVNWLLSLCCFKQYYLDGPKPETLDLALYEEGKASSTMKLDVWRRMEKHLGFLNDHDIGVHMFLGFDGGRNEGPAWNKLSDSEKEFYVRYVVSRIAPYANLAGWNFVWEVEGTREAYELGLARLIKKYDVFDHLRTYEDEMPRENAYDRPEYNFAAVENHRIGASARDNDRTYWKEPWTHHAAVIESYRGKPVYMSEGNALWRRYWHEKSGANQEDLRRAAWACATGGASFNWNGHLKEYELYASGPTGLPFSAENPYFASERYVDILCHVMTDEVAFYRMTPQDNLLKQHDALRVWALAEAGKQYLVFASHGEPFAITLADGSYANNVWIDAKTGVKTKVAPVAVNGKDSSLQTFTPPTRTTDWVLILRTEGTPVVGQEDPEAAYTRTITERAAKIVASLGIVDLATATQVRDTIADQYRNLRDIHDTRDARIKAAKEQAGADKQATDATTKVIQDMATALQDKLHAQYLKKLSSLLTPEQVDRVKDGMTYGVLKGTYDGYLNMLPNLTIEQKDRIMAFLVEARELAMDAGSSDQKHATFGKYKGKINNYLSAQGYDLKKASQDWAARRNAATEDSKK